MIYLKKLTHIDKKAFIFSLYFCSIKDINKNLRPLLIIEEHKNKQKLNLTSPALIVHNL